MCWRFAWFCQTHFRKASPTPGWPDKRIGSSCIHPGFGPVIEYDLPLIASCSSALHMPRHMAGPAWGESTVGDNGNIGVDNKRRSRLLPRLPLSWRHGNRRHLSNLIAKEILWPVLDVPK